MRSPVSSSRAAMSMPSRSLPVSSAFGRESMMS
jgi:hypothetical protein